MMFDDYCSVVYVQILISQAHKTEYMYNSQRPKVHLSSYAQYSYMRWGSQPMSLIAVFSDYVQG